MINHYMKSPNRGKAFPFANAVVAAFASQTLIVVMIGLGSPAVVRAQAPVAPTSRFEVASIKPCNARDSPSGGNGRGGGAGKMNWSPGRLAAECQTLENLIREAYLRYHDGKSLPEILPGRRAPAVSDRILNQPIKASEAWINSDRYTIEATAGGSPAEELTRGPMLQLLLEDRFKLKIHHESREIAVYNLTVANGGPKLTAAHGGSCVALVQGAPLPRLAQPAAPSSMPCGLFVPDNRNDRIDMNGTTIANFSRSLSAVFDRDVVDKTGLAGLFDIHLDIHQESRRADAAPAPGNEPAPAPDRSATLSALQAAIPKLGLKLEAAKASAEFIVIDHVERPVEN